MGEFILGAVAALFVGMRLARLIDGRKGAREGFTKAKSTDVAGARKKASDASFALFRFVLILVAVIAAVMYGLVNTSSDQVQPAPAQSPAKGTRPG
ncbi:hypothetical protein [Actinoplanes sp. G11-F43]|uniref:hypothetical protein n=1 Tax=Actinoplanes sp. G11-F43 TaxID=3424130 RepID=UPI003D353F2F